MKVFLIDAYDSFVYIISHYLASSGLETKVERNDVPNLLDTIDKYEPSFIVLGPGPGHPKESGYLEVIRKFEGSIPIMGVCLGHQAIGMAYGARVECAEHVMHGKVSKIQNDGEGAFLHTKGRAFEATRYHSLIVDRDSVPPDLAVSANSEKDQYIMGVRHRKYPVEGVQFHPESILTNGGNRVFESFIKSYCV